jgi:uncharacterized protein (TIGR02598 family)
LEVCKNPAAILMKKGFTLIEMMVAIGIAGFCLVTMMGLLSAGLRLSQRAANQTEAGNILTAVYTNLGTNTNNRCDTLYYNDVGNTVASTDMNAKYKVNIIVSNSMTNIRVWWPVNSTLENSEGMLEVVTHSKF